MKSISIPLTIFFLLLMVVPSIANDYYQGNSEYERVRQETENYNANVLREYERQMREYDQTIRANRSLLRRVQEQFPEIGAEPTASELDKDLQQSPAKEDNTTETTFGRQRKARRYHQSPRTNVMSQGQVSTVNTNNKRVYEEQRREYERQVKEYEVRQKEAEKRNAELRKEYERQKAEVEKHNAEVQKRNEQIRQYNAEQRARYNAQQQETDRASGYREWKPYLEDKDPNRPYYMKEPVERGWDSAGGGGGNPRHQNYQRQTMPNQQRMPNQGRRR